MKPLGGPAALRERLKRLRARLRPPRRLRFHRAGWIFSGGAIFLGVAAIATGNNLLFLMLGAMLGFITLSGWMSEQVLRRLVLRRRLPAGVTAGRVARFAYEVENGKPRLSSFALELGEFGQAARAFVAVVEPGSKTLARLEATYPRRGVYPLRAVTVGTSFPFGLFRKERDFELPAEVVVWPRTDRPVRMPRLAGQQVRRSGAAAVKAAGARGEFRGLRDYRPGDDPRDVHWRSSAGRTVPIVREYERDDAETLWICLELRAAPGEAAEAAVEIAAALAAEAHALNRPFGLVSADARVVPEIGTAQLERVLDVLARARFRVDAPAPAAPVSRPECVLVAPHAATEAGWGAVLLGAGSAP